MIKDDLIQSARVQGIHSFTVRAILAKLDYPSLLLLQRAKGTSYEGVEEPPGGKVEPQETLVSALMREVKEETGMVIDADVSYLGHMDYVSFKNVPCREFFFFAKSNTTKVTCCPKEHSSYRWANFSNVQHTFLPPEVIAFLSRLQKKTAIKGGSEQNHYQFANTCHHKIEISSVLDNMIPIHSPR